MKKRIVIFLFLAVLFFPLRIVAQNDDSDITMSQILEKGLQQKKDKTYNLTPFDIANDYDLNVFAADEKYKDKNLGIVALVGVINRDVEGNPFVLLKTDNNLPGFGVYFPSTALWLKKLSKLQMFDVVKIKGKCNGLRRSTSDNGKLVSFVVLDGTSLIIEPRAK